MPQPLRRCWSSVPKDAMKLLFTWTILFVCLCGAQSPHHEATTKRVLKATSIQIPPFLMVSGEGNDTLMEGIIVDILNEMGEIMNASFEIVLVKDNRWGQQDEEGNWTGMIGEVKSGYADVAAAPITMKSARLLHVDMSYPFLTFGLRIVIKIPELTKLWADIWFMFQPFTSMVWILIVVSFGVTGATLSVIGRFSPLEWTNTLEVQVSRDERESFNWKNSFWFIITTFMWQGYRHFPRSYSGRILSIFWWMFTLVTLVLYIGCLAAHLQSPPTTPNEARLPFSTFNDLARQKEITYGTLRSSSTLNYFKNSRRQNEQMIYENMMRFEDNMVSSYAEGVEKVRSSNGRYAVIMEGWMAEYETSKEPCDLVAVGDDVFPQGYSFVTEKGSPLSAEINLAILQLQESNIIQKIHLKWERNQCFQEALKRGPVVGGHDVKEAKGVIDTRLIGGPLILLLIGIVLSGIVLAAEVFFAREETKRGSVSNEEGHQLRDSFEDAS